MSPSSARQMCLVVDDDMLQRQISVRLMQRGGWSTVEAENGQAAIERINETRPDLVLMDLQMPVLDGHSAIRRIRSQPNDVALLPVIACTSERKRSVYDLQADGFDGLLIKPIDPIALGALAAAWSPLRLEPDALRLEAAFSRAEMDHLWQGLSDQLVQLLSEPEVILRDPAHRIAGLAGTLGFKELSKQWLAVSEGRTEPIPSARRLARAAISRIAAHRSNAAKH